MNLTGEGISPVGILEGGVVLLGGAPVVTS